MRMRVTRTAEPATAAGSRSLNGSTTGGALAGAFRSRTLPDALCPADPHWPDEQTCGSRTRRGRGVAPAPTRMRRAKVRPDDVYLGGGG